MAQPAKLALEDGTIHTGISIGATGEVDGEVCFNTSMTGYQEILTDPSYRGQIVTMTYPQIGNYGVNGEDLESSRPRLAGFIVREQSRTASNFRSDGLLNDYLKEWGVVAIESIDTRALVKHIRTLGALRGVLSTLDLDDASLVAKAQASPGLVGRDLVREVVPEMPCHWEEPLGEWAKKGSGAFYANHPQSQDQAKKGAGASYANHPQSQDQADKRLLTPFSPHVVALDYGMKWNIPRHLVDIGCQVTILPGTATAEEVLAQQPDGVFLSNGPGDPEPLEYAIQTIRNLLGRQPMFGICLGHQLLSLACGAKTFKMKFGHRGANQPVQNLANRSIEITSQNHGFAVQERDLPDSLEVTHRSLNDQTIEGVRHRELPAFSVQYHPEASAGPHDSHYLFRQFHESMR